MAVSQPLGDVALFVDWENLKGSLNKTGLEPNISSLRDTAEQFGRVVIASAYADWQDPWHQEDPFRLYAAGIQPVYVPTVIRHGDGGASSPFARRRNSVDVKITSDCIECCFKYPNIKTFLLVSGDGDFVHLVNTLRPYGKGVVAVGVSWSTSGQLAQSVDRLLYYDKDVEPIDPPTESLIELALSPEEEQSLHEAFERVIAIIKSSQRGDRALLSWIKHEMIKRYGPFDEKRWGFSQFKTFMREAEVRGLLKIAEIDLVNWALLPEAEENGASRSLERGGRMNGRNAIAENPTTVSMRARVIQFAHSLELRFPYVSFTFLLDHIMEAELFPYDRQEVSDFLNDAVEDMIFLHSSIQESRGGSVRTIRTIMLNHNHPDVQQQLGEVAARPTGNNGAPTLPRPSKPGGDAQLAADLKSLANDPDNGSLEYRIGERLYQLGRYREASDHLKHAVSLLPDHLSHHYVLIRCLAAGGQRDEALSACRAAIEKFADRAEPHVLLGQCLAEGEAYEEALVAYKRALALMPEGADGRDELLLDIADVEERLGQVRPVEATAGSGEAPSADGPLRAAAVQATDGKRTEGEKLGRRAASLVSQVGREDEVIALAEKALGLCQEIYQPHYALGEVFMRRGQLEQAASCFERAIPLCPSPGAVYSMRMRLVSLYDRLGREADAGQIRSLLH